MNEHNTFIYRWKNFSHGTYSRQVAEAPVLPLPPLTVLSLFNIRALWFEHGIHVQYLSSLANRETDCVPRCVCVYSIICLCHVLGWLERNPDKSTSTSGRRNCALRSYSDIILYIKNHSILPFLIKAQFLDVFWEQTYTDIQDEYLQKKNSMIQWKKKFRR